MKRESTVKPAVVALILSAAVVGGVLVLYFLKQQTILDFLFLGILMSGIYALFALGLSLVFGVMDIINAAHGELYALGGYFAFTALLIAPSHLLSVVLVIAGTGVFGFLMYYGAIRPLARRSVTENKGALFLVLTLGISILLKSVFIAVLGAGYKSISPFVGGSLNVLGIALPLYRVVIFAISIALLVLLSLFVKFTKTGMAIRAVEQNAAAAQAVGIALERIYILVFCLASVFAGLAGWLLTPILQVWPTVGAFILLKGFAIVILGGLGSMYGVIIASVILGVTESFTVLLFSSEWRNLAAFVILFVILLVKPSGLLGRRKEKR